MPGIVSSFSSFLAIFIIVVVSSYILFYTHTFSKSKWVRRAKKRESKSSSSGGGYGSRGIEQFELWCLTKEKESHLAIPKRGKWKRIKSPSCRRIFLNVIEIQPLLGEGEWEKKKSFHCGEKKTSHSLKVHRQIYTHKKAEEPKRIKRRKEKISLAKSWKDKKYKLNHIWYVFCNMQIESTVKWVKCYYRKCEE